MERVDGGGPDQAAPRLVEARPVGDDVDGAHVADLPMKELRQVHHLPVVAFGCNRTLALPWTRTSI